MDELLQWIPNVGFPIAVCAFLLIRLERALGAIGHKFDAMSDRLVIVTSLIEKTGTAIEKSRERVLSEVKELRRDLLNAALGRHAARSAPHTHDPDI